MRLSTAFRRAFVDVYLTYADRSSRLIVVIQIDWVFCDFDNEFLTNWCWLNGALENQGRDIEKGRTFA